MKINSKYILSALLTLICALACEMEPEIELNLTEKDVVETYTNTMYRANAVYTFLPNGFAYFGDAMLASACDEAEHTNEGNSVHQFNTGAWSHLNNPDNAWDRCFGGIYAANLYLEQSGQVKMDYLKFNPSEQAKYELYQQNLKNADLEVRFLRAFFYFELVHRYGGVPILEKTYDLEDDISGVKRDTFADCINFIVSECTAVAEELPSVPLSENTGRVTKGAALALKSRALLYAASDLYNDTSWAEGYANPELISMTDDKTRQERWDEAALAAKAVLDLKEARYVLAPNYPEVFTRSSSSNECIFVRREGSGYSFEQANFSVGFDKGNSGTTPSQNLVDAFEMKDGSAFDWNNPNHVVDPFANRDPRLEHSVVTHNSWFYGRAMDIAEGGKDGKGVVNATRTGYYLRKYVDQDVDLLQGRGTVHAWVIFRLAEIYLNYAEAMNEAYGPMGDNGYGMNAVEAVNKVRSRNGVGMPPIPFAVTKEELREKIRNERRVELCFEGHRMFDVRRWMIAQETIGQPLRGVEIQRSGFSAEYTPIELEDRKFEAKMYFYPIPQSDAQISKWPQNPLW